MTGPVFEPRVRMSCPSCGSPEIAGLGCDATWSEELQDWLSGTPDTFICIDCDREFNTPHRIAIPNQEEAA